MGDSVLYDLIDHVATITYNRPEALNAINGAVRDDLNGAFARFRDDEDAWVAIVTGAGRAFCVGADLTDSEGSVGTFRGTFWEKPTMNSFESGWEIFKPVIAAVNGYCLGYGLTLVTWCDFVIASERAEFGYPEVTFGTTALAAAGCVLVLESGQGTSLVLRPCHRRRMARHNPAAIRQTEH